MLDYAVLKVIWWALMGALLIGFAILGGRDIGVGLLLPLIARRDDERRILLNSVGPTWEGNQVWFITFGGALFAAWPFVYAAAFSGLYIALFVVLLGLILRPPGFDYRSKLPSTTWRTTWDWLLGIGSLLPALLFGVAFGNLFLGLPFHYDADLRLHGLGGFFALCTPFTLLAGVLSVAMLTLQGALFIQHKTEAPLADRARRVAGGSALVFALSFFICGYLAKRMMGYQLVSMVEAAVTPLQKSVALVPGAWGANFHAYPILWALPLVTVLGLAMAVICAAVYRPLLGLFCSSLSIALAIISAGVALFPFILPSSTMHDHGLTIWDATASQRTLQWMLVAVVIFLPIVLAYTLWVFHMVRGKVRSSVVSEPGAY